MYVCFSKVVANIAECNLAPLTDELKEELRRLNRNNITGYQDIIKKLARKGYKVGHVSLSFDIY